jgi:hypothetical protein
VGVFLESSYALFVPMAFSLATVFGGSCNDTAFRFSRRCSTDEVPYGGMWGRV